MSSVRSGTRLELLLSGYIREKENEFDLYMNVPDGIDKIMHELYPLLMFKFGDCNPDGIKLNEDRTILIGNNPKTNQCNGHVVYADLGEYNDIGLNKGIHFWSIKSIRSKKGYHTFSGCYASIGVTTEKNDEIIKHWDWRGPKKHRNKFTDRKHFVHTGYGSHCQKCYGFSHDVIVTTKLDCNDWSVTYYKDKEQYKKENIPSNQYYYLAMLCCGKSVFTNLQVVETDDELRLVCV